MPLNLTPKVKKLYFVIFLQIVFLMKAVGRYEKKNLKHKGNI